MLLLQFNLHYILTNVIVFTVTSSPPFLISIIGEFIVLKISIVLSTANGISIYVLNRSCLHGKMLVETVPEYDLHKNGLWNKPGERVEFTTRKIHKPSLQLNHCVFT